MGEPTHGTGPVDESFVDESFVDVSGADEAFVVVSGADEAFVDSGPPAADDGVAGLMADLGLVGLIDIHVHLLPARLQRRIWHYFDAAGPKLGRPWPITYRWPVPRLIAHLEHMGVRHATTMPYAHRPGLAADLTRHSIALAQEFPLVVPTLTFFPEPGVLDYVTDALSAGARAGKVHLQVGDFDPRRPELRPVWGALADARLPVVVHAGSGPVPGTHTGIEPLRGLLREHPDLTLVVAHMGGTEFAEYLDLAENSHAVHLDTTMVFTDFFEQSWPYPPHLRPRLGDMGDRILFGSDFPSIPYPYRHAVDAILGLGLGSEVERSIFWGNAARLLGLHRV